MLLNGSYGGGQPGGGTAPVMVAGHKSRRDGVITTRDEDEVVGDDGNLIKVAKKHNSVPYYFAKISLPLANREIKSQVYEETVAAIRNSSEKNWGVKTNFLHMGYPMAEKQAKMQAVPFKQLNHAFITWTFKGFSDDGGAVANLIAGSFLLGKHYYFFICNFYITLRRKHAVGNGQISLHILIKTTADLVALVFCIF
eukprot:scaffold4286_cov92-Amphora_coffeaeformis.AAC.17